MRGFPWAPMATCTSLTPCRTTAARTTAATLLSPDYAPSSRRSPWLSQSGAVGLQNTKNMARRDAVTPCLLLNQQLILHEIEGRTAWLFLKKFFECIHIDFSAYLRACLITFRCFVPLLWGWIEQHFSTVTWCVFSPVFGCSMKVNCESDDTEETHLYINILKV